MFVSLEQEFAAQLEVWLAVLFFSWPFLVAMLVGA